MFGWKREAKCGTGQLSCMLGVENDRFSEELHGIKALLARLLRVDGAYLRFTGELSLEHYQADTLVETHRDEALWELMYFGHVTQK